MQERAACTVRAGRPDATSVRSGSPRARRAAAVRHAFRRAAGEFKILLLELEGLNLLLDEPTDSLDLVSADALQSGLDEFEGTVIAVTRDRWFARSLDRLLVFDANGLVRESPDPVWN